MNNVRELLEAWQRGASPFVRTGDIDDVLQALDDLIENAIDDYDEDYSSDYEVWTPDDVADQVSTLVESLVGGVTESVMIGKITGTIDHILQQCEVRRIE